MFSKTKKRIIVLAAIFLAYTTVAESAKASDEFLLIGTYFRNFSSKADNNTKKSEDNDSDDDLKPDDKKPDDPVPVLEVIPVVRENGIVKAEKNTRGAFLEYYVSDDISSQGKEALWMTDKNTFVYNDKTLHSDSEYTVLVENEAYFENNGTITGDNAGVKLSGASKMINNGLIANSGDKGVEVTEGSLFMNNGIIKNGKNFGIMVNGKNSEAVNGKTGVIENGDINDLENTGLSGMYISGGALGRNEGLIKNTSYYGVYVTGADSKGINESTGVIRNGAVNGYGYFGMYADNSGTIINYGLIENLNCRGMYAKGEGTVAINEAGGIIRNGTIIDPYTFDIAGMQATKGGTVINKGRIETIGMYGMTATQGSHAVNEANGVVANTAIYGMYAESGGKITNHGKIQNDQNGMYAGSSGTIAVNEITGIVENMQFYGMYVENGASAFNKGKIQNTSYYGMHAYTLNSLIVNEATGIIQNKGNYAMLVMYGGTAINYGILRNEGNYGIEVINGTGHNFGTIENTGNYGMSIIASSTGSNSGTIYLKGDNKTGVYVANSTFTNDGAIILEGKNNIGIRAMNSNIILTSNSVITLKDGNIVDTITHEDTDFATKGEGNTSTLGKFYSLDSKSTLTNGGSITGKTININGGGKFILDSKTGTIKADNLVLENDIYINTKATLDSSKDSYEVNNLNVGSVTGNGKIISDSKIFTLNSEKTEKGYQLVFTRKNFQDIYSGDLGNVLEANYEGSEKSKVRNKVYNALKQINSDEGLKTAADELTAGSLTGNQIYQQYTQNKMINAGLNTMLDKRDENVSGTYVNFFGNNSNVKNYNNINGYDSGTSGILLGRMEKIAENTALGGFFGYINTQYNYKDKGDSQQISDTWILSGAVEQKLTPNLKWISVLSYNTSDNDTERKITYDNSNTDLTGNFRSWSAGGSSTLEYKQKINNYITIKPVAGIILDYIEQDAYTEEGGAGVSVESYNGFSAKAAAGVKADFTVFQNNNHKFMIQPKAYYTYEMSNPYDKKQITMTGFTGIIGMESRSSERNNLDLGMDLEYTYKDKLSFYAGYESGVSSDDRLETITGGFKIMF